MPEIKKKCHWYDDENRPKCTILSEFVCKKGKCTFYETDAQYKARNDKFINRHGAMKMCGRCKEIKPIEEFGRKARNSDEIDIYCRKCNRERKKRK